MVNIAVGFPLFFFKKKKDSKSGKTQNLFSWWRESRLQSVVIFTMDFGDTEFKQVY